MRRINIFGMFMAIIILITIPVLILGDTLDLKQDASEQTDIIITHDPITSFEINDVNMAKEMQDAIDALETKGVDISELKNLKTEYAAYSSEERLAMLEDDFENVMKYQQEKEKIVISFSEILTEEGLYNFDIYKFTKNHNF